MENVLKALRNARRVVRAEAGITGEEGLYKPKITKERKIERRKRSERFSEAPAPEAKRPRPGTGSPRPLGKTAPGHSAGAPRKAARKA